MASLEIDMDMMMTRPSYNMITGKENNFITFFGVEGMLMMMMMINNNDNDNDNNNNDQVEFIL